MKELVRQDGWFNQLIEDCKDIVVESSFASRWALIEGYHQLGERIIEDLPKLTQKYKTVDNSLQQVAVSLGKSTRSIYYAYAFATKFPDLNKLPEGKNTLWRDMVHKYLPEPEENKIEIPLPKVQIGLEVEGNKLIMKFEKPTKRIVLLPDSLDKFFQDLQEKRAEIKQGKV